MSKYYYSKDKIDWQGPISQSRLLFEVVQGNIEELDYIWYAKLCPNKVKNPAKCSHLENAVKAIDFKKIPYELFLITERKNVSRREIRKLVDFDIELINKHFRSVDEAISIFKQKRGKVFENCMEINQLNKYEVLLISGYADFIAKNLNNILRNPFSRRIEGFLYFEYLLNKSLSKMMSTKEDIAFVMFQNYEGEAEFDMFNWFENRINESVQFPNFLSSSRKRWKDHNIYLEIAMTKNGMGKYIGPLTNKLILEEEILFPSNSKFLIKGVDRKNRTIHLAEIGYQIQANYLLYDCFNRNIRNKEDVRNLI